MGNRITLDNPGLAGRLRSYERSRSYSRPTPSRRNAKSIARHVSFPNIKPSSGEPDSIADTQDKSKKVPLHYSNSYKDSHRSRHSQKLFVPAVLSVGSARIYNLAKAAVYLVKHPELSVATASFATESVSERSGSRGVLGIVTTRSKDFFVKFSLSNTLLYVMAVVLFVTGMAVTVNSFMTNRRVNAVIADDNSKPSGSKDKTNTASKIIGGISVEKPSADYFANYTVASDLPKYISIPKLGVNTVVLPMGVDSNNKLLAPDNIYNTGWYNGSSRPGENGGMLIEGHSGVGNYSGIFSNIDSLSSGDSIEVTRGDDKVFTYKIVAKKLFDAKNVDMNSMMVSKNPDKPGLNLISCYGDAVPGTTNFSHRVIVYAVQE